MHLCCDYYSSCVLVSGCRPIILNGVFRGLPSSIQVNVTVIFKTRELPPPPHTYSLSNSKLWTATLNMPQMPEPTVFVHSCLHTLAQATGSALVAVRLVHHTAALRLGFTHVLPLPPDGSLEEPGTAAASRNNATSYTS